MKAPSKILSKKQMKALITVTTISLLLFITMNFANAEGYNTTRTYYSKTLEGDIRGHIEINDYNIENTETKIEFTTSTTNDDELGNTYTLEGSGDITIECTGAANNGGWKQHRRSQRQLLGRHKL